MLGDLVLEVAEDAAGVVAARPHRPRRDRATGEEAVGRPHRAELEAAGGDDLAALAEQELGRAAADVDEQQPPVEDGDRLEHPELDQASLLDPRDDLDVDPGLVPGAAEELLGVGGLAHRARGHGAHRGAVAVDDAAHPLQRGDAPVDGVGVELLHVAAAVAEADHLPLAGERLEPVTADRAGDDEMEAVGADVERRQRRAAVGHVESSRRSVGESSGAGRDALEHALAEAGDLLEPAAQHVVGRRVVADDQRGLDRLVEIAGFDLGVAAARVPWASGMRSATQAPVRQSDRSARSSPARRLPSACWAASLHAVPSMYPTTKSPKWSYSSRANGSSKNTSRVAAQYTAPVARSPAGSSQSTSSAASTGTTVSDGSSASTDARACGQKSFRSSAMSLDDLVVVVPELGVPLGIDDRLQRVGDERERVVDQLRAPRGTFGEPDLERADPVERRAVAALGELVDADRVADRDHRQEPDAHVVVGELDGLGFARCGRGRPTRRRSSRPAAR